MRDYSLNKDIDIKQEYDWDHWAEEDEPDNVISIDNLRLDPDAAARYREIRKAREQKEHGRKS